MEPHTEESPAQFRKLIYEHYRLHGRALPWRLTWDPYCVFVSEIMLQQTQVGRVLEKYGEFIGAFPDFPALAGAPLARVLSLWQGLGYNRRALWLKEGAIAVMERFSGSLPQSPGALATLPGIGPATAASIAAFAFNEPTVFIETNIRTVFIHFFFHNADEVRDSQILPLVSRTLDRRDPRTWYYALMDYGTMLKKEGEKGHRRSAGYRTQSRFHGSDRQVRGAILKLLVERIALPEAALIDLVRSPAEKVRKNLGDLQREGFVRESEEGYTIV
ncbi:MAG: A/G-specific adenine glycosylase [Syntrophorhabdales bacterium]|jgi:A/G-specific adenine glycosylase